MHTNALTVAFEIKAVEQEILSAMSLAVSMRNRRMVCKNNSKTMNIAQGPPMAHLGPLNLLIVFANLRVRLKLSIDVGEDCAHIGFRCRALDDDN